MIALLFMLAGTAMSAFGEWQSGEKEAREAERNARLAEQTAKDSELRGELDAQQVRQEGRQVMGAQRVAYATSGVDVQSGSAQEARYDTAVLTELDAQTVRVNAARDAWGYRTQGLQYKAKGELDRQRGQSRAAGTVLTGVGQAFNSYRGTKG